MPAILDFTKFNFSVDEIRVVKELVYDEVIAAPEIDMLCTVYPGIVYDKQIGFTGQGGLVGVAGQGCNPTPQAWNIGTRAVKWEPKAWEILIAQCAKDLEATAAIYSLKTGLQYFDFTSTDYIAIVVEVLMRSIKEFMIRLAFFSDKLAKNVANGGQIKDGVDTKYFTIIDGFFKQMEIQITANAAQRVTIAENAGANYVAQKMDKTNVQGYLEALVFDADPILRANTSAYIYCTQSFYDAYAKSLQGLTLESMYTNLVNGTKTLTYNAVPLVPVPVWDAIIASYYNNGTKLFNPHRAIYYAKENLAFGVDAEGSFGDLDVWYNKDTREVKLESMGKADAKMLNPVHFKIAI